MYSMCVILPYFIQDKGHWPSYIDWFFASCKANETIDFHIFSDDASIEKWGTEKNIIIHHMTFPGCVDLIHKKLNGAKIDSPYKLCDYKPCYGVIFEDWTSSYDYWASCDCDLLFGNIREHFLDSVLEKYDKMMVTGQLQISKNTKEINHYYELPRPVDSPYKDFNWERVSGSTEHFAYDEFSGVPMLVKENGKSILWDMKMYANIYQKTKNGKHLYDKMIDKNDVVNRPFQYWHWKNGGIYHVDAITKKETSKLFIHFTERTMKAIPYTGQSEIFITENSEIKDTLKFKDTVVIGDCIRVWGNKIIAWMKWKITHLNGKKAWEV